MHEFFTSFCGFQVTELSFFLHDKRSMATQVKAPPQIRQMVCMFTLVGIFFFFLCFCSKEIMGWMVLSSDLFFRKKVMKCNIEK